MTPDVAARVQPLVDAMAAAVADLLPRQKVPREPQNRALPDVEGETGLGDHRPKSKKAQGRNYDGGVR